MTNTETPAPWYRRYIKALVALLGGVTTSGLIALLAALDIRIDITLATVIVAALTTLATAVAPKNA